MGSSAHKGEFDQLWARRRTRLRAEAVRRAWPTCAAASAVLAFLVVLVLWWNGTDLWRPLPWIWISAFAISGVVAWWKGQPTSDSLSLALRELDSDHQAQSAFLAQSALLSKRVGSRLAPLVGGAADAIAGKDHVRAISSDPFYPRDLGVLSGLLIASILLAALPRGSIGNFPSGLPASAQETGTSAVPTLEELLMEEAESEEAGLHEHWVLRIGTPHRIYKATEAIPLFAIAEPKLTAPDERTLEAFLLVSPAEFPEEDRRQLRPQPWGELLTTPAGSDRSLPSLQDLQQALKRADLAEEGQVAVDLFARDPSGKIPGWIRSNRLILALTVDHETKSAPTQQNVGPESMDPERKPAEDKEPEKSMDGEDEPALGDKKRLEDVELQTEAVAPLLSDGTRVQKEVKLWNAEESGGATAPPKPLPVVEVPRPTFTRREEPMPEEARTDEPSRRLLHRYFQALRRDG